jgi:fructose-2,6-bisphosphatase
MLLSPAGQGIDEPLSETGLKQAVAAGGFLTNVTFTHAFSSDLTRTKQVSGGSRSEDHELCKFERFT